MLHFNKLRVSGFKSFVDPAEFLIELGLTGVVGPNGCGKSNLVEALRWVMGETSARQMRGGREDVIFGGTESRSPRNVAEVVLTLDNTERSAPARFNDADMLEVSRRIERDKGSTYRLNGKEVRARDVQLLFADSATGARSTALVSQGRIGAIISAKPQQRRGLLEEAAGITGLHSRRHEAELRLGGAETNLDRLDDVLITLDEQLSGLKKQGRQATRYRNLSDHIRKAEATLFFLHWQAATAALTAAEYALGAVRVRVADSTGTAARAATRQADRAQALPDLRQAEATAAAGWHRLTVARDNLEAEQKRLRDAEEQTRRHLEQNAADADRARRFAADAEATEHRLGQQRDAIDAVRDDADEARKRAAEDLGQADDRVADSEAELNTMTARVADIEARRDALRRHITEWEARATRLAGRLDDIAGQRDDLDRDHPHGDAVNTALRELEKHQAAETAARAALAAAEAARTDSGDVTTTRSTVLRDANAALGGLQAEAAAISKILAAGEDDLWPPLIDAVSVESGYEAALGAALGDDLNVPADEAAPVHWRTLAPLPLGIRGHHPLPAGARPLGDVAHGPPALARRLAAVGVVATDAEAAALSHTLTQGQRLVSRQGGLWRWDGYTVSSSALTPAAVRLEQRNRLERLREQIAGAGERAENAEQELAAAQAAEAAARDRELAARRDLATADAAMIAAREALTAAREHAGAHANKRDALAAAAAAAATDREEARAALADRRGELADLPDPEPERENVRDLRLRLTQHRTRQLDCRTRHDQLEHQAEERTERLQAIATELQMWQRRNDETARQLADLAARREKLAAELQDLAARPDQLTAQRQGLMDALTAAEAGRQQAADALATAEGELADAERQLRAADAGLSEAREERVRVEGAVEQAKQAGAAIAERVADRLSCEPADLFDISGLKPGGVMPGRDGMEGRVDRLLRERENMGPVNLRAEQEAAELSQQIDTLKDERTDLLAAIDKLRRGISELNREGRARLLASFEQVNGHFQDLFVRLFGGGRAHLALTDSEDPLEAGLEIMACPPGKKLQILSLLSGGEQALTALALLFGVFLTNPAPICVLDEVDAPLDDANVDRFCMLLEEMAEQQKTRFLIITHQHITMARMHRLFGVTMSERGVSQLVSVDLQQAEGLRHIA